MESNFLLIVGTFVYKERVEFFSFVLHCLPWERQERGVARLEQLEIIILQIEGEISHIIVKVSFIKMLWLLQILSLALVCISPQQSILYLQLGVDCSSDFIGRGISWIVNCSHRFVCFHFPSFKHISCWNEAAWVTMLVHWGRLTKNGETCACETTSFTKPCCLPSARATYTYSTYKIFTSHQN